MAQNGFSYRRAENGALYVICDELSREGGCSHFFSTRIGGFSGEHLKSMNLGLERGDSLENLEKNYNAAAKAAGISENGFCFTKQVHGDEIRTVTINDIRPVREGRSVPECDGLVTANKNTPLVCVSADCVPILIYAPQKGICGVVHAGWRGTALGIVKKAVMKLKNEFSVFPYEIIAAIGPSISACCFLTHMDVPEALYDGIGAVADGYINTASDGRYSVDLKGINAELFRTAGVERVFISEDCTCCNADKYYSHRRDGAMRGSMAAVIELKTR